MTERQDDQRFIEDERVSNLGAYSPSIETLIGHLIQALHETTEAINGLRMDMREVDEQDDDQDSRPAHGGLDS